MMSVPNHCKLNLIHPNNEICLNCSRRRGEHYRGKCTRWSPKIGDLTYPGTKFEGTGLYANSSGDHFDMLKGRLSNPNLIFKGKMNATTRGI